VKEKENSIAIIKATISQYLPDAEIMLFGSRARSDAHRQSDYDILIKTRDKITTREKIVLRTNIRKELLKQDILTDILIQSVEEIERKKNLPGHIIRNLLKDAVIL
jgi:predicted nucleotidyltransferase